MPDSTRDLNNFLQSHGGNLTRYFSWLMNQEGPDHQRTHHATAKFRGQVIGYGRGLSTGNAKQAAAEQAMQYLNSLPAKHPLLSSR